MTTTTVEHLGEVLLPSGFTGHRYSVALGDRRPHTVDLTDALGLLGQWGYSTVGARGLLRQARETRILVDNVPVAGIYTTLYGDNARDYLEATS